MTLSSKFLLSSSLSNSSDVLSLSFAASSCCSLLKRLEEEKSCYVTSLLQTVCKINCSGEERKKNLASNKKIVSKHNSPSGSHFFSCIGEYLWWLVPCYTNTAILIINLTFDTGFVIAAVFVLTLVFAIFPVKSKIWQYLFTWCF